MSVLVIGNDKLSKDLDKVFTNIKDTKEIAKELDSLMNDYVHVLTGYLKSSIYHKTNVAGAKAPYAGFEEERGESHEYATKAIDAFDVNKYIDRVISPF